MQSIRIMLAIGVIAVAAPAASAQDGAALVQSKGCLNCHALDQAKMGPSFKSLAQKYADNATAETTLIAKLKNGTGHGKVNASDDEIKAMVDYVLQQK